MRMRDGCRPTTDWPPVTEDPLIKPNNPVPIGGASLSRRRIAATLVILLLNSCSPPIPGVCDEGISVEVSNLFRQYADRIVQERAYDPDRDRVILYADGADLIRRNPECCHVETPRGYNQRSLTLPQWRTMTLSIVYRKYSNAEKPYSVNTTAFDVCPKYEERSRIDVAGPDQENYSRSYGIWRFNDSLEYRQDHRTP
jgi:hypothetical protein